MSCRSLDPHFCGVSLQVVERYPAAGAGFPMVRHDGGGVQTLDLGAIVVDAYHGADAGNRYRCLDLKVDAERFPSRWSARRTYRSSPRR